MRPLTAFILFSCVMLAGAPACSPSQKISNEAQSIVESVGQVQDDLEQDGQTLIDTADSIDTDLDSIDQAATTEPQKIAGITTQTREKTQHVREIGKAAKDNSDMLGDAVKSANKILSSVPGVEDKFKWQTLAFYVLIATGLIALAVIVWRLGPAINLLGWFAPRNKKAAAKLVVEGRQTEAIAVMRADDRALDREINKQKTAKKKKEAGL